MKKVLFISMLVLAAVMTSCQSPQPDIPECKYHAVSLDLTVMQPDWQFDNETQQYYFHFDVPEITSNVYNFGNWTICREYFGNDDKSQEDDYQVALPLSMYKVEEVVNKETNETTNVYYTQHIDYRLGIGFVEIQVTNSDYIYSTENPESMYFRLQLIY